MKRIDNHVATLGLAFLVLAAPVACAQDVTAEAYVVDHVGSQRATIMEGQRGAKIDLVTLSGIPHLYAIGPLAGVHGEITIIDGRPSLARVAPNGTLTVSSTFEASAAFLVWAEAKQPWREEPLPQSVKSLADLEEYLSRRAVELGLTNAFPFTLSGEAADIGYHVLNAAPEANHPVGADAHKAIQAHFHADSGRVSLVGFYSTAHEGVFISAGSRTHIHFQTADNTQSGHVESVDFGQGAFVLTLPK